MGPKLPKSRKTQALLFTSPGDPDLRLQQRFPILDLNKTPKHQGFFSLPLSKDEARIAGYLVEYAENSYDISRS